MQPHDPSPRGDAVRHLTRAALDAGLVALPAVPGDDWSRRPPRKPEAQLTVMRREVAEQIANGQP